MKTKDTSVGTSRAAIVCLLAVATASLCLLLRTTDRPESIPVLATGPEENASTARSERFHRGLFAAKPANEPNDLPETVETALTRPDELEDMDELREWARQYSGAALAWLLNAAAGPKRDTVLEIVCAQLAQSNPAQAVELAERFASDSSTLQENMLQQWADQNATAAYTYATNKPPGEPRDRLLSRVAFVLAKESPVHAAKVVAEQISPGDIQEEAALSVLHQWALRDARAAAAWVESFPEGTLRTRAFLEIGNLTTAREIPTTF